MIRRNNRRFSNEQVRQLKAEVIQLASDGYSFNSIAAMFGLHYSTVTRWTRGIVPRESIAERAEFICSSFADHIRSGGDPEEFEVVPCDEPCSCPIGSFGRVETYRRRQEAGQTLWHEQDSRVISS